MLVLAEATHELEPALPFKGQMRSLMYDKAKLLEQRVTRSVGNWRHNNKGMLLL